MWLRRYSWTRNVRSARRTLAGTIPRDGAITFATWSARWPCYDAKIKASFNNLGRGGVFTSGYRLDVHSAALLTEADINRTLSAEEAERLIARFQRGRTEGKKPAASSIRRRRERRSA